MRTIWKYELAITDEQVVPMQMNAKVLTVAFQGPKLFVWAEVETHMPKTGRVFNIVGTGNEVPPLVEHAHYIGTAFDPTMPLVWHVYLEPEAK